MKKKSFRKKIGQSIKKTFSRACAYKITGLPYAFIMMFLIVFLMQLIMLLILVKMS